MHITLGLLLGVSVVWMPLSRRFYKAKRLNLGDSFGSIVVLSMTSLLMGLTLGSCICGYLRNACPYTHIVKCTVVLLLKVLKTSAERNNQIFRLFVSNNDIRIV